MVKCHLLVLSVFLKSRTDEKNESETWLAKMPEKTKFLFFFNKKDMNHNDVYRFGKGLHRNCMLSKPFEIPMKCV